MKQPMSRWAASPASLMALSFLLAPAAHTQALPQAQAAPAAQAQITTIRARTELVVVDVVVEDAQRNPVHDLKQSGFKLFENGAPQEIRSFEEHRPISPADAAKRAPMPRMPPGVFTNLAPAPANGTVNVLLLDALNTPMDAQAYVRGQLLAFLKTAPPGTRLAIFGLTTRLLMLQGFTADPEVLKSAMLKKAAPKGSVLSDNPAGTGGVEGFSDAFANAGGGADLPETLANLQQFDAQQAAVQTTSRAQVTLDAMNQLARYLASIPGRKNLIWFSGSFPLNILPDGDIKDPFAVVADSADEFRETSSLLSRSQVAVYPIDARGLQATPIYAGTASGVGTARSTGKALSTFSTSQALEHGTMMQMAEETGGHAFVNTNGLSEAVMKAINSGSNYYTLSYTPASSKRDGDFRRIKVDLEGAGYTLSYRKGYYADDPGAARKPVGAAVAAAAPPRGGAMAVAMMRGAPSPTEILFKARILPAGVATEVAPAKGNLLTPDPKAAVKGPFRRYLVDFAADPRSISFTPNPDGSYHFAVEFATYVYDPNGVAKVTTAFTIRATMQAANYKAILNSGFPFHQEISVPAKGEYFLRSAVHDLTSNRVGAVEVPVSAVQNLPPLASAQP